MATRKKLLTGLIVVFGVALVTKLYTFAQTGRSLQLRGTTVVPIPKKQWPKSSPSPRPSARPSPRPSARPSPTYPGGEEQLPVLLTAFSSNHFDEAQGLVRSIHEHLPLYTLIVYDMGLEEQQRRRLVKYCRCEVRTLDFLLYPRHVRNLTTFAFKPLIVAQVLEESGFVFWLDASVRFVSPNVTALWQLARSTGFAASNGFYRISCLTHPRMYAHFGLNDSSAFREDREIQATFLLFYALPETTHRIVDPWRRCALDPACIAPDGPRRVSDTCDTTLNPRYCQCHRFDQSALNLIIYGQCLLQCRRGGYPFTGYLGFIVGLYREYNVVRIEWDKKVDYFPPT